MPEFAYKAGLAVAPIVNHMKHHDLCTIRILASLWR